jgi:hypothetical protein
MAAARSTAGHASPRPQKGASVSADSRCSGAYGGLPTACRCLDPALMLAVRECGQDVARGLWVFALLGLTT